MKKIFLTLALILVFVGCSNDESTKKDSDKKDETVVETQPDVSKEDFPVATITMESGDKIVIELNPKEAPNTVNNFISLANSNFYDGVIFHRVIADFMIQGGDPEGTGQGGPGYSIKGEFSGNGYPNTLLNKTGTIAMARTQIPDSAGSQFFINVADNTNLDGQYAVFGTVTEGYEFVEAMSLVSRNTANRPYDDLVIKTITVDTKGFDYPQPETIK